jgi:hypothetical protein
VLQSVEQKREGWRALLRYERTQLKFFNVCSSTRVIFLLIFFSNDYACVSLGGWKRPVGAFGKTGNRTF